ncbi:hypothetical protein ES703_59150 [subsurface metagenome]
MAIKGSDSPNFPPIQQNLSSQAVFQHCNLGSAHLPAQGGLNILASGITPGVQDAGDAVRRLHGQGNPPVKGVKGNPKVDQFGNAGRGFGYQDTHRLFITQVVSSSNGILQVKLLRIIASYGSSNTPLGMFRIAVFNTALGHNEHAALLFGEEGSIQSGNTAANYNIVILVHQIASQLLLSHSSDISLYPLHRGRHREYH